MITYWSKLINGKHKNMQNYFMTWVLNYSKKIEETLVGLKKVHVFLYHIGLSNIWLEQTTHSTKWLKAKIKLTLTDQFKRKIDNLLSNPRQKH